MRGGLHKKGVKSDQGAILIKKGPISEATRTSHALLDVGISGATPPTLTKSLKPRNSLI